MPHVCCNCPKQVALKEAKIDPIKVSGSTGTNAVGQAVGATAGAALGAFTGLFGAMSGAKGGKAVGKSVAGMIMEKKGKEEAGKINKTLGSGIYESIALGFCMASTWITFALTV